MARPRTVRLHRRVAFEASHALHVAGLSDNENRARFGREVSLHGHNWTASVAVEGPVDPATGMVLNIADVDRHLRAHVVAQLDHRRLDTDHPYFRNAPPTAENVAVWCWSAIGSPFSDVPVVSVRVAEGYRVEAEYWGAPGAERNTHMVDITRAYEFSASHRLHSETLSDARNQELYGKCNNPTGHGHDYRVEVTVSGPVAPETGSVVDLPWLDELARREIVERMDYRHLNTDVAELQGIPPTTENLTAVLFDLLEPHFADRDATLRRVRVYETPKSWFDVEASSI
jgi:6-pyruvoyltetrahydropterin/6-carboxytetrahydropterin synthase